MSDNPNAVRPGQVWADNDPRSAGRTLRVDAIEDGKAVCTILTNDTTTQARIDGTYHGMWAYAGRPQDRRGKTARVSLSRFKPARTGYRPARTGYRLVRGL